MEKYYDYDGIPLVEKEKAFYRYGKDGDLTKVTFKPNPDNLTELTKENFDGWIKEGKYHQNGNWSKLAPHLD